MKKTNLTQSVLALAIIVIGAVVIVTISTMQSAFGQFIATPVLLVPIAISGDNVYLAWSSNKTGGNYDVMFRASNDNGATFGDKINLSNTPGADSVDADIEASGDSVFVTWWERNQTDTEPVIRISSDGGQTFGPILQLAANGSIGSSGGEEEGGGGVEQEE
jgi:ABC-type antimicrobial peptide transport system permease subunit